MRRARPRVKPFLNTETGVLGVVGVSASGSDCGIAKGSVLRNAWEGDVERVFLFVPTIREVIAARREDFRGGRVKDWFMWALFDELEEECAREAMEETDMRWMDMERRLRGEACCSICFSGSGDDEGAEFDASVSRSIELRVLVGDVVVLLEDETMVIICGFTDVIDTARAWPFRLEGLDVDCCSPFSSTSWSIASMSRSRSRSKRESS